MKVLVGTRVVELVDLDPAVDQAMFEVFRASLSGIPANLDVFKSAVVSYFQTERVDREGYYRNFSVLWHHFFANGRMQEAERVWTLALEPVFEWERATGQHMLKGTPYYWWAMTAFEAGRLDLGYALMHQAFEEDKRDSPSRALGLPAFLFVSLDHDRVDQAYRSRVLRMAAYVNEALSAYQRQHNHTLAYNEFSKRFLKAPPDPETLFLFSYVVGRLLDFAQFPAHAVRSVFAGQLAANILFDLALVVDSTLRSKNPTAERFIDQAAYLASNASLAMTKADLKQINGDFNKDFDATLQDVLMLTHPRAQGGLASAIAATYGMRNRGAHQVTAGPAFHTIFDNVRGAMFDCLFLTVETLY